MQIPSIEARSTAEADGSSAINGCYPGGSCCSLSLRFWGIRGQAPTEGWPIAAEAIAAERGIVVVICL